jgi:ribosomal protein L21
LQERTARKIERIKPNMDKQYTLKQFMENFIKVLSAVFDSNGGTITLDKDILENAVMGFYVTSETVGDKIILTKVNGKSEAYYKIFPKEN